MGEENKFVVKIDGKEVFVKDLQLPNEEVWGKIAVALKSHIDENKEFYKKLNDYVENYAFTPMTFNEEISDTTIEQDDRTILYADTLPFAEGGFVKVSNLYKCGEDDED